MLSSASRRYASLLKALILVLCPVSNLFADQGAQYVSVIDDAGREVHLVQPAKRIVSMSPGLTEMVFAIGGGHLLAGTVSYSDYPEAAKSLPVIGDSQSIDYESLLLLQPDLVLLWASAQGQIVREKLTDLGIPFYVSEVSRLNDVADTMARLSLLTGVDSVAVQHRYTSELDTLSRTYSSPPSGESGGSKPLRVFVQIWHPPLMTIGSGQFISEIVRHCGGESIFDDRVEKSFAVTMESVLARQPDVVLIVSETRNPETIAMWQRFPTVPAVKNNRFLWADPDLVSRAGPRMIQGLKAVCEGLNGLN